MEALMFFLLGIIMGSFLNVVIYRLPANKSIIYPSSYCAVCNKKLAWYELVPVISFLLQRGKCRTCRKPISAMYPLVEIFTGIIYLSLWKHYGFNAELLSALLFVSILIPIVIIDLDHQIIPDKLNIVGGVLGLLTLPIATISMSSAFLSTIIGGGIMLLIAIISSGGMGGGDIKMMAWMGLFLGWKLTLLALFLSFILGGIGSLFLIAAGIKKRKDFIPFGPFLALGGFTAYVFGCEILAWYISTY